MLRRTHNHFSRQILAACLLFGLLTALSGCGQEAGKGGDTSDANVPPSQQHKVKQIAWRDLSYIKDTVFVDSTRTWNYVFYNTGYQPVRIKQALSSNSDCTCKVPDHEVPMGEQDTVKLTCKFTREGRESVNIEVEHDTPQPFPLLMLITTVVKGK